MAVKYTVKFVKKEPYMGSLCKWTYELAIKGRKFDKGICYGLFFDKKTDIKDSRNYKAKLEGKVEKAIIESPKDVYGKKWFIYKCLEKDTPGPIKLSFLAPCKENAKALIQPAFKSKKGKRGWQSLPKKQIQGGTKLMGPALSLAVPGSMEPRVITLLAQYEGEKLAYLLSRIPSAFSFSEAQGKLKALPLDELSLLNTDERLALSQALCEAVES